MFSSVSRQNNALWHMKTLGLAGHRSAVRSRSRTTLRTRSPIEDKRRICLVNFATTKRWVGAVLVLAVWGRGLQRRSRLVFLHVGHGCFHWETADVLDEKGRIIVRISIFSKTNTFSSQKVTASAEAWEVERDTTFQFLILNTPCPRKTINLVGVSSEIVSRMERQHPQEG